MRRFLVLLIVLLFVAPIVYAGNGLINVRSSHNVKSTADRLEKILKEKGMTVFARVDHAAGAQRVGMTLLPTELLIFGNPKVGTPLMQCSRSAAIDLPQKALIWEDTEGRVWITYNDPKYIAKRHGITECTEVITKIENALKNFTHAAAKP